MVRVIIRAFIIILLCIPFLLGKDKYIKKKVNYFLVATEKIEEWKSKNKNLARVKFHNVKIRIKSANANGYNGTAETEKLVAFSDQTLQAHNSIITFVLNENPFVITINNFTILKHSVNNNLIAIGSPCQIQYSGINIQSKEVIIYSENKAILLKECSGTYKDFNVKIDDDIEIEDYVTGIIRNVHITNAQWDIKIKHINCTAEQAKLFNINGILSEKYVFTVDWLEIGKEKIAYSLHVKWDKCSISTSIANIIDENNVIFPETIIIQFNNITFVCKNGKKVKEKIIIYDIEIKNANGVVIGHSDKGYIDTKQGKCILEDGRFLNDGSI